MSSDNTTLEDDQLSLAPEPQESEKTDTGTRRWKVLIVDDDHEIHSVTKLALDDFIFDDAGIEFLSAYSSREARELLQSEHHNIALILLDVVMETDDAGLQLAQYIREQLDNHLIRIILRTGNPGIAPEREVITRYEINDYRAKTELTQARMFSVVYTALSSYRHLRALVENERRLQLAVGELEEFAYIAAHDLQSPIRGIVGFAQLLQRRYKGNLDERGDEYLDTIVDSAKHMQSLIADLLSFSRIDHDQVDHTAVDCQQVLDQAVRNLESSINQAENAIESGPMPTLPGNQTLLVQLFQNLIGNGIKFRAPDRPPKISLRAEHEKDFWHFTVADNGIGVLPANQDRIFKVFQRLHTADEFEGTGIGLAICRKVVAWHGGEIWLESKPDAGTTFHFTLPVRASRQTAEKK